MSNLVKIARLIKELTYDDTMEMAQWFSDWTTVEPDGTDRDALIDRETMAANLSDWADNIIDESNE